MEKEKILANEKWCETHSSEGCDDDPHCCAVYRNFRKKKLSNQSLLSFLPFPHYTVYSATKAFVLAFTETLVAELEGSGVVVTALCPGPVDTPFQTEVMWKTNAYRVNKPVSPVVVASEG